MTETDRTKSTTGTLDAAQNGTRRPCMRLTLLPLVLLLTMGLHSATAAPVINDDTIRAAILNRFQTDIPTMPDAIAVQVDDGIVLLSGSAANLLHRRRARQIAESIRGVRAVVDNTRLKPLMRDDAAVARDVHRRLRQGLNLPAASITVTVEGGAVTLSGTVDSWVLSRLIARRAMAVSGVTEVVDQLDVQPGLGRNDQAIQRDIRQRYDADLYIDARQIHVTVGDGQVTLDGTVPTLAQKRRAEENAWIAGVIDVAAEDLDVDGADGNRLKRQAPYTPQTDEAVREAVEDALRMDPRVNATLPDVFVVNGAVTLTGIVDTLYARRAAEADARNTTGVWKVDNQLRLRYRTFPPDDAVKRMITDVLRRDAELSAAEIEVTVEDNHVELTGSVPTMGQKVRAENIISQIEGVLTLDNRIHVSGNRRPAGDAKIASAIADEWFWSPYVDSDRLTVSVSNGLAVIKGRAVNRFVARIAVQNAFEGGARSVRTRLALDDGSTLAEIFEETPDPSPEAAARWLHL